MRLLSAEQGGANASRGLRQASKTGKKQSLLGLINVEAFQMSITDSDNEHRLEISGVGSGPQNCPQFEGSTCCIQLHTHTYHRVCG